MNADQTDEQIRTFYEENAARLDVDSFKDELAKQAAFGR